MNKPLLKCNLEFSVNFLMFLSLLFTKKNGTSLEIGSKSIGSKPEPYPTKTERRTRSASGPAHLPKSVTFI